MPPKITISTSLSEWQERMNKSLGEMAQSIEAVTRVVREMPGLDLDVNVPASSPESPDVGASSSSPVLDISAANRVNKHLSALSIASTAVEFPTMITTVLEGAEEEDNEESSTPTPEKKDKHISALSTTSTVIDAGPSSPTAERSKSMALLIGAPPPMPDNPMHAVLGKLERVERAQAELRAQMKEMEIRMHALTPAMVNDSGYLKPVGGVADRLARLEKKVDDQEHAMSLEQLRLPARLHNATCHNYPQAIVAPPIVPGKVPKNFPTTKGEFEHLTKERYEDILNDYKIKYTGDTDAKRETLRGFLGLPPRDSSTTSRRRK